MRHRHDSDRGDRPLHPGQSSSRLPHYAARQDQDAYDGLPALTNREWGPDHTDRTRTYGYPGQGGYGDFTDHQGRYGESQGRHAQSGHGRGGVEFGGHDHDSIPSRGLPSRGLPSSDMPPGNVSGRSGHRGHGPRDYVRSDARITDDIIDRLTDDAYIDASEILVMVENGVVTLTGNVPERRMKHRAEDLVADAMGVRDVRNTLRVDDGSASFGPPGQAVRSGRDQLGSGFSSSARPDPVYDNPSDDSNWPA
jgi:hypothetical protein